MRHYVTVCDLHYLPQAVVLHESLLQHSSEAFTLHMLPLDEGCEETLAQLELEQVAVIPYEFHRQPSLQGARLNRSWPEYCWTMASCVSEHLLRFMDEVTYLDADMLFFSDPKVIFDEIGDRQIAVIPHRLIPSKKHLEVNGRFNVSWVTFRKGFGYWCAKRWSEQCLDRCSAEVGCGDQCYLDSWPGLFQGQLCIIENIGAGLAPWNLANYALMEGPMVNGIRVVFYHYHEFRDNEDGTFRLTNYELRPEDVRLIYEPYLAAYRTAQERIRTLVTA